MTADNKGEGDTDRPEEKQTSASGNTMGGDPEGRGAGTQNTPDDGVKKPLPVKLIVAIVAAAVVVVVILLVVLLGGGSKTRINMNDYISINVEGYDTIGTAQIEFDYDAFSSDFADLSWNKTQLKKMLKEELSDYGYSNSEINEVLEEYIDEILTYYSPADTLSDFFVAYASLDVDSELSNGDTVTLVWDVDEEELELFTDMVNCTVVYADETYTVADLEELETYNPFDDVEISFEGTEPGGTASISVTGSGLAQSIKFSFDVSSGLSNGDTVTVSVSNDADAFVSSDGVIISPTEQKYTVEGLSYYITSAEEIPDEDLARMQEEVQDSFDSYVASSWGSAWTVKGFDYIGTYLLTSKTNDGNIFYMVYQVNAEYFKELSSGFSDLLFTYYYYVRYDNLIMNSEDELQVDYLDFGTVGNDYTIYSDSDSKYRVKGYETLDEIYKVLVTERADSYTCEDLVEDSDFGYEATRLDEVAAIPDDAKEFNGHYYKLYSVEDMTWTQAREQCELRGGHLVTITTEDEMNFLVIQLVSGSRCYWTGGYYDASEEWLWITGESMDYTDWLTSKSAVSYPYITLCEAGWMQNEEDGGNWGGVMISLSQGYNSTVIGYICEWDSDEVDIAVDTTETVEETTAEPAEEAAEEAEVESAEETAEEEESAENSSEDEEE